MDSINEKIFTLPTRSQLVLNLYYCQSLLQSGNIRKALEITRSLEDFYKRKNLDSIEKVIYYSILLSSLTRVGEIERVSEIYIESSEYIKKEKEVLLASNDNYWYYYYSIVSANLEIKRKKYTQAFDTLKQTGNHFIRKINEDSSSWFMLSWIYILIGQIHKQTNYLGLAINDFKKAIDCSLKAQNLEYLRTAYLYLALTYEEEGREYLVKLTVQDLIQETEANFNSDEYSISSAYNLLGNINNRLGEFQVAKDYYSKAFLVVTDPDLKVRIKSYYLNNMGVISFKMANYEESLKYFKESLELATLKGDPRELAYYYSNVGESLFAIGKYDEAIANELQAIDYIDTINNDDLLVETYFILIRIYIEQEDYEKANPYIHEIHLKYLETNKTTFQLKYKLVQGIKLKRQGNIDQANQVLLSVLEYPHFLYDIQTIALTEITSMLLGSNFDIQKKYAKEIEKLTQKLQGLVREKNSLPLLCYFAIFSARSQIMMNLNFHSAELILQEAHDLCLKKNVEYFRQKIEHELEVSQHLKYISGNQHFVKSGLLLEKLNSFDIVGQLQSLQRLMLAEAK